MKWNVTLPPTAKGVEEIKVVESEHFSVQDGFALFYDGAGYQTGKLRASFPPQCWGGVTEWVEDENWPTRAPDKCPHCSCTDFDETARGVRCRACDKWVTVEAAA